MSVEIFVARHGQNHDNAEGLLNGHRDRPLTELGRDQARNAAKAAVEMGLHFDKVYSSPLLRAFETAEIISDAMGLSEPEKMDILIERDFGDMTGKMISDIPQLYADDLLVTDTVTYALSPPNAETFPELVERGKEILATVRAKHVGGKVLLVCHGDIGKMIYAAATGLDWKDVLEKFHFGNCDLIDINGEGDVHKIKLEQQNT